jgi:hypothetical protein
VEWSSSQLLQNTPLHPIADWSRQRFSGADVPAERRLADLAVSAQEIASLSLPVQLGDAPAAGDPVHNTGAEEIGPRAAESAGHVDDADGFLHILPLATSAPYAIGKLQSVRIAAH